MGERGTGFGMIGGNMPSSSGYYTVDVEKPVEMEARNEPTFYIPPFCFVGQLEIGVSGYWYPTTTIRIKGGSISASGLGTSPASIYVMKKEPGIDQPLILGSRNLSPTAYKTLLTLPSVVVTPYDGIFIASFAASGHTGIVIQLVGTKVQ